MADGYLTSVADEGEGQCSVCDRWVDDDSPGIIVVTACPHPTSDADDIDPQDFLFCSSGCLRQWAGSFVPPWEV